MYRLLLLEDDLNLQESIAEYLEDNDFLVSVFSNGLDAQDAIFEQDFDLLILDVNVPDLNGFDLLHTLRKENKTLPAIFTTSRNSMDDLETGFESGCDDYMRKPYALKELLLRIETLLKRDFSHNSDPLEPIDEHRHYDVKNSTLYINDRIVHLQEKEHQLLKLFLKNKGRALSHEAIQQALWTFDETPSDTALRTYIKHLRQLLGKDSIVNIKRIGYQFSA